MHDKNRFYEIKSFYERLYTNKGIHTFPYDHKRIVFFLKFITEYATRGKSLDIGCGVGYACEIIQAAGFEVYGIDISQVALEHAANRLPTGVFKPANESGRLDFDDEFFDAVTCIGVLEHIQNPLDVLEEAFRVLKNGGKAVFVVPNSMNPYFFLFKGTRQIFERARSLKLWKEMFTNVGFKTMQVLKDPGPSFVKEDPFLKKAKIIVHKTINRLPIKMTYQLIFCLEK